MSPLPERLARADALRRRWRPDAISINERDLSAGGQQLSQDAVVEMWRRFAQGGAPTWATERVSLYLHALLCPTRCTYCHCTARQPTSGGERAAVLERLMSDIAVFAPVVKSLRFRNLYFGGGTPSIFHAHELERLFDALFSGFTIAADGERTIEMNPANARLDKLRVARQAGFDRVSFGVETLTDSVLEAHDRGYQRDARAQHAIEDAHKAGFPHVNMDLIILPGETAASFREVVRTAVQWLPTEIHLYRLQPAAGYAPEPHTLDYRVAWELLREIAGPAGYTGIADYHDTMLCARAILADRRGSKAKAYVQQSEDLGSTLGLGPGAESLCRFMGHYTDHAINGDPSSSLYLGATRDAVAELRAYLMSHLVRARPVAIARILKRFGQPTLDAVEGVMADLEEAGWVSRTDSHVQWRQTEGWQVVTTSLAMATEDERHAIRQWVEFHKPSTIQVAEGPVGDTGWQVGGADPRHPGFFQLLHSEFEPVLFRLEEDDGRPALARDGGLQVRYHGSEVPEGSIGALRQLLRQAVG